MSELSFRPIQNHDRPFLQELYRSTRENELDQTGWLEEQKATFIDMQFNAQHDHYQKHFSDAQFDLILQDDEPIGRLYVVRREDELRIIDIALAPGYRGSGIGGKLMQELIDEASGKKLPVRIHVEQFNPALRLYERLGFRKIHDEGVYFLMEWRPPSAEK